MLGRRPCRGYLAPGDEPSWCASQLGLSHALFYSLIGSTPLGEIPNPGSGQPRVPPSGNRAQLAQLDKQSSRRRLVARQQGTGLIAWRCPMRPVADPSTKGLITIGPARSPNRARPMPCDSSLSPTQIMRAASSAQVVTVSQMPKPAFVPAIRTSAAISGRPPAHEAPEPEVSGGKGRANAARRRSRFPLLLQKLLFPALWALFLPGVATLSALPISIGTTFAGFFPWGCNCGHGNGCERRQYERRQQG